MEQTHEHEIEGWQMRHTRRQTIAPYGLECSEAVELGDGDDGGGGRSWSLSLKAGAKAVVVAASIGGNPCRTRKGERVEDQRRRWRAAVAASKLPLAGTSAL